MGGARRADARSTSARSSRWGSRRSSSCIERRAGAARGAGVPRWLAILVDLPRRSSAGRSSSSAWWSFRRSSRRRPRSGRSCPSEFNQLQSFLIRYKLMTRRVTLAEAVQNAPSGIGRQRRQHGARRALERHRRRLRPHHDPDPELLPADRSRARCSTTSCGSCRRAAARDVGDRGARGRRQGQRVAARAVHSRRRDGHVRRRRPRPDGRAVLLRRRARRGGRRDDPDRRADHRRSHGGRGRADACRRSWR